MLWTNSDEVMSALRRWRNKTVVRGEGFELRIAVDEFRQRQREYQPGFRGMEQFVFATFHGSDHFVFDLQRKTVTGVVSYVTAKDEEFWNTVLIPIAVGVLGCTFGAVPIHAACLTWSVEGVLLAGVSGTGKSTLAVALARLGLRLVSDDWTYVRTDGELMAHGLSVPVKLLPDAIEFFPELRAAEVEVAMNGELAYEVDPKAIAIGCAGECRPRCVVFVERSERNEIVEIGAEIVAEFFTRSGERLPARMTSLIETRAGIIDRIAELDCWVLRYSGRPADGARYLKSFLEGRYGEHSCA